MKGLISVVAAALVVAGSAAAASAAPRATSASDIRGMAGTWEGTVWETPASLIQGHEKVRLHMRDDGTWTAVVGEGSSACHASGTAALRRGRVVLDGTVASSPRERARGVHMTLATRGGDTMWGRTPYRFQSGVAPASVTLHRVG